MASILEKLRLESNKSSASGKSGMPDRVYLLIILLAGLLSYIPGLGSYGLLDPTDSFFLESAREAVETNQFLLPLNNYTPWLDKPILYFWMVSGAYKLFGISPFVGRLPAALSAVACSLIIFYGCRPILKPQTAALAALIFLANPLVSIIGHVCLTDMTLCALICGSILFLFKGIKYSRTKDFIAAYIFLALAFLCKGPIAVVIAGLGLLPYLISICRRPADFISKIKELRPLQGILIMALINLPWYTAAALATNGEFLVTFFYTQNFGRMVGTVNHQGPWYFYIPVFFGGLFPWSLYSLSAAGMFKSLFNPQRFIQAKQAPKTIQSPPQKESTRKQLFKLCAFWFTAVMIMFSAIKTKLPTYILPAVPAFAVLIAMQLETLLKAGKLSRLIIPSSLLSVGLIVAVFIQPLLKGYLHEILSRNFWALFLFLPMLISAWICIYKGKSRAYLLSILSIAALACPIFVLSGLQSFYASKQLGFSKLVEQSRDAGASLSMIFAEEPSAVWISHKPVSRLQSKEDAAAYLKTLPAPHYVLVQTSLLPRLDWFEGKRTQMLAEHGKWHLFQILDLE